MTPAMSKALDEELELHWRHAKFMLENAKGFTFDDLLLFVKNQMKNKAYPRIREEYR